MTKSTSAWLKFGLMFVFTASIVLFEGATAAQTATAQVSGDSSVESSAQSRNQSPTSHTTQIEAMLTRYHDFGQLNASVLVAEDGEVIVEAGYGLANMEWEIPNTPNTKFRIGSVTKQFTAALIMLLVEEGKIKLDEPITTYLPNYRKDTGDQVTVHQLLCHTSGIPSYTTPEFFEKHSRESYELDEFIERFASGDLQFSPGSEYSYNNSGYHLLGAIIEKVTGSSYADYLQERILDPAGMSDSGFDVSATILKHRAQGYSRTPDGFVNAPYLDMGIPYSAGSMYSTVGDLFRWVRSLRANRILKPESKQLMMTPNLNGYGYGLDIDDQKIGNAGETTKIVQHGGGIHGFNSQLSWFVDQNHTVVILDNVQLGEFHNDIIDAIVNILNDQPFQGPRRSLATELRRFADENDGPSVVARYKTLKSQQPDTFDFDNERALNDVGYHLLGNDNLEEAIEVFKLNVKQFPESFNVYDSLGEAYLKNGQTELARDNYQKSVELNPDNEGGVFALKKIAGETATINEAALQACVGQFEFRPGFVITFTVVDGVLMGKPTGQENAVLEPTSDTTFLVPKVKAKIEFQKNNNGEINGVVLTQGGQRLEGKRIEPVAVEVD